MCTDPHVDGFDASIAYWIKGAIQEPIRARSLGYQPLEQRAKNGRKPWQSSKYQTGFGTVTGRKNERNKTVTTPTLTHA